MSRPNRTVVTPDAVEVDVDGMVDGRGVRLIGSATLVAGEWVCLADVGGCLCRVAVTLTPVAEHDGARP